MSPHVEGEQKLPNDYSYFPIVLSAPGEIDLVRVDDLVRKVAGNDNPYMIQAKGICIEVEEDGEIVPTIFVTTDKEGSTHSAFYEELIKSVNGKLKWGGILQVSNIDGDIEVGVTGDSTTLLKYLSFEDSDNYRDTQMMPKLGPGFAVK